MAKKLVKCKAKVVALSKTEIHLNTLKTEVPEVTTVCLDVTSPEIQVLIESYGPFDGLVNNAALAILEPFLEASESNFDK